MDEQKRCTQCGEMKALGEYAKKLSRLNSHCRACQRLKNIAYREKNRAALDAANAKYRVENADALKAKAKEWRGANKDTIKARNQAYYERLKNDPDYKSKVAAYEKEWRAANKDRILEGRRRNRHSDPTFKAKNAENQARRRACMPKWVKAADVRPFYDLARKLTLLTGIPHEVDHIIPIRGNTVSGLHVPSNLQVIPKAENRKKRNVFIGDPEATCRAQ